METGLPNRLFACHETLLIMVFEGRAVEEGANSGSQKLPIQGTR